MLISASRQDTAHARRCSLGEALTERRLDAIIVTSPANIRYLSGFTGSNGVLLVLPERAVLFTDPRYGIQAGEETGCRVRVVRGPLLPAVEKAVRAARSKRIGFERSHLRYNAWEMLDMSLPARTILVPTAGLVETLRMVKSEEEIGLIRRSMRTAARAFEQTIRKARPGMREFEFAAELDHRMRKLGAEQPAFETIVASGARSALPHASPTDKPFKNNELLMVDMGALQHGYTSDMTRMAFFGRPTARVKCLYRAVVEARQAAQDAVRDGVASEAVDRAARQVLRAHGLDRLFIHSTGHGLGLEIHEPPRVGKRDPHTLRAGMVITLEPGVYSQEFGGIRIEDTVVVTRGGCEVLTPASKELVLI